METLLRDAPIDLGLISRRGVGPAPIVTASTMLCLVQSEGNCGNGDTGRIAEPRPAQLHTDRVEAIAWHQGHSASATGRLNTQGKSRVVTDG